METQSQDTHTQDPIDPFTLHIQEMRRRPVPRGFAGLVHNLFVELFTCLFMWMAEIAQRNRDAALPTVSPGTVAPDAAPSGGALHGQIGQALAIAEQPSALPPPRRTRVRPGKTNSRTVSARRQRVGHGSRPQWDGAKVFWNPEGGFLRFVSKNGVKGAILRCDHFVTI